jgi:drug/metabolite transporter (DMT)-like permease
MAGVVAGILLCVAGVLFIGFRSSISAWNSRMSDKMLAPGIERAQDAPGEYNGGLLIAGSVLIIAGIILGALGLTT